MRRYQMLYLRIYYPAGFITLRRSEEIGTQSDNLVIDREIALYRTVDIVNIYGNILYPVPSEINVWERHIRRSRRNIAIKFQICGDFSFQCSEHIVSQNFSKTDIFNLALGHYPLRSGFIPCPLSRENYISRLTL